MLEQLSGGLYDPERKPGFYVMKLSPQTDHSPRIIDYWNGKSWYTYTGVKDLRPMRVVQVFLED